MHVPLFKIKWTVLTTHNYKLYHAMYMYGKLTGKNKYMYMHYYNKKLLYFACNSSKECYFCDIYNWLSIYLSWSSVE